MISQDLERVLRWEGAGGTWRVIAERDLAATVSLCRCDGGEEADRFISADPVLLDYLRTHSHGGDLSNPQERMPRARESRPPLGCCGQRD